MPVSVGAIVEALEALGGEAHYKDIAEHILENGTEPFPADPAASVRARLQERCSDYTAYKDGADLFESEQGSGVWRFRVQQRGGVREEPAHYSARDSEIKSYEAQEGRRVPATHYRYERNTTLIKLFKAGLEEARCTACQMTFEDIYGEYGEGYIEAHHIKPLATLDEGETTSIDDLTPLCANCHRVIHKNELMSVEELSAYLQRSGGHAELMSDLHRTRQSWKQAVQDALLRLATRNQEKEVSRQQIVEEELEQIVADVQSNGKTPAQTLSRILQELRDDGVIEFTGGEGHYRLT